jgi:murein DD-endopeptidase MepM/ murein hydrolase activator NlpD
MAETVKVKKGDTLSAIAKANNTTVAKIAAANPQITNVNLIKPNQVINIPAPKATTPAPTSGAVPNFKPTITPGPNTSGMFVGPIPTGTTRTTSGYVPTVVKDPDKPDPDKPKGKKEVSRVKNADGTFTVTYDDGTTAIEGEPTGTDDGKGGTKYTADDGTIFTDQAAFVAYQSMLRANAKNDYNAAQALAAKAAQDKADKRDAFALIQDTMKSFGFTDTEVAQLTAFAETQIMDVNIGPNQGILNMKALPVYQARFSGNQTRLKAGKNALSEADYLAQENAYGEYMKAYGVQSLGTRDQFATLIGNDVSATELNKRLNLAVDRVKNSDPEILKQLKTYYPSITDSDLVTYFLKPADALPDLEKKVATSEISAAAVGQGFSADMTGAAALQAFGVTREKALTGYQDLKTILPVSERLAKIYGESGIKYDRAAGEAEFLTNSADAAEKRRRLKALERGAFSAQTGVERGTSLTQSTQGQF